jgi:hypothetical protein
MGIGYVESFGRSMIEAFLEADSLNFLRDRDGDFIVQFGFDEEIGGHPRFLLAAVGDDQEQYCLRGETYRRVPRADWDRAMRLCNEWNALYKMPKAYLEIDDPNTSASGRVICEQWVDLEAGAHQELVNSLTSTFFSACFGFWRWLVRQDAIESLSDPLPEPGDSRPPSPSETEPLDEADDLS